MAAGGSDAAERRKQETAPAKKAVSNSRGGRSSGKVLLTYAHPLFWAPYSIIGDGG